MMEISIQRSDQRFRDRWRWPSFARRWASEVGPELVAAVRDRAPVGKKEIGGHNGQLRDSISYRTRISSTGAVIEVGSTVPYAGYVVHGTPPHIIQPRTASRLHWVEGGNHFYRYRVNHPGAKANPFPERAMHAMEPIVQRGTGATVMRTLEGL